MGLSIFERRSRSSHIVFHIDVNSAFLSWSILERLEQNPDNIGLRTMPSAVVGDVASRHGVMTVASIPAKRPGVKSGEPINAALRPCPNLVLVASNSSYYRRKFAAFLEALDCHSSAVEQSSIDKASLDMSAHLSDRRREEATIRTCAAAIQTETRETLGFTVSIGISENKLLAKMASDFEKSDKAHTLWPGELSAKFHPFPIRAFFGVGDQSAEKLLRFGIHTIGEAAAAPCEVLQRILGPSVGEAVYQSMHGISHSAVWRERPQAKSHSVERTTTTDIEKRNAATEFPPPPSEPVEGLSSRFKKANVCAKTLVIIAKTSSFRHHTCQQRLLVPDSGKEVLEVSAREFFSVPLESEDGLFSKWKALRLVGIGTARLEGPQHQQLSLFSLLNAAEVRGTEACTVAETAETEKRVATATAQTEKRRKLGETQIAISVRYGDKALFRGEALLSAGKNEIPNTQIKSKQQGVEIKEP